MCILIPEIWAGEKTCHTRRGFLQCAGSSRDVLQAEKALNALGRLHSRVYPCSGMDSSCTRMAWHSFLPWSFPHRPRGLRILGLQVKLSSAKAPEARGATRIIPHKVLQRFPRLPSFHTQTFVSWLTQIQHQMRYCSPLWLCHRREGGERKKQKAPKDYNC